MEHGVEEGAVWLPLSLTGEFCGSGRLEACCLKPDLRSGFANQRNETSEAGAKTASAHMIRTNEVKAWSVLSPPVQ